MKNRTHHDILAKVLQTAKGTDGITKTRIMYGAFLFFQVVSSKSTWLTVKATDS